MFHFPLWAPQKFIRDSRGSNCGVQVEIYNISKGLIRNKCRKKALHDLNGSVRSNSDSYRLLIGGVEVLKVSKRSVEICCRTHHVRRG